MRQDNQQLANKRQRVLYPEHPTDNLVTSDPPKSISHLFRRVTGKIWNLPTTQTQAPASLPNVLLKLIDLLEDPNGPTLNGGALRRLHNLTLFGLDLADTGDTSAATRDNNVLFLQVLLGIYTRNNHPRSGKNTSAEVCTGVLGEHEVRECLSQVSRIFFAEPGSEDMRECSMHQNLASLCVSVVVGLLTYIRKLQSVHTLEVFRSDASPIFMPAHTSNFKHIQAQQLLLLHESKIVLEQQVLASRSGDTLEVDKGNSVAKFAREQLEHIHSTYPNSSDFAPTSGLLFIILGRNLVPELVHFHGMADEWVARFASLAVSSTKEALQIQYAAIVLDMFSNMTHVAADSCIGVPTALVAFTKLLMCGNPQITERTLQILSTKYQLQQLNSQVKQLPSFIDAMCETALEVDSTVPTKRLVVDILNGLGQNWFYMVQLSRQPNALEVLVEAITSRSNTESREAAIDTILRLASNVCNRRLLAKHRGLIASLILYSRARNSLQIDESALAWKSSDIKARIQVLAEAL